MELACHIAKAETLELLDEIPRHLTLFYPSAALAGGGEGVACTRVYIGDEFCAARMPGLPALRRLGALTLKRGLGLTLLTPVMTDSAFDDTAPLLDYLGHSHPDAEVVCNDWGVLHYLRARHPRLKCSAGRVLDKGFKDPRWKSLPGREGADATDNAPLSEALLDESTFDGDGVRDCLAAMGVGRLERDLLPHRSRSPLRARGFETSIYYPFGYVTSGRICWIASLDPGTAERFVPPGRCSRPCNGLALELKNPAFGFRIFQSGNTIFYLYPPAKLESLFQAARTRKLRLVYQGFGFQPS